MQIPDELLQALTIYEASAKTLASAGSSSINFEQVSLAYEKATFRWMQCIERFLPNSSADYFERHAALKTALEHYDRAVGYYFRAINDGKITLTTQIYTRFINMELNLYFLRKDCHSVTPDTITSSSNRVYVACKKLYAESTDKATTGLFLLKAADNLAKDSRFENIADTAYKVIEANLDEFLLALSESIQHKFTATRQNKDALFFPYQVPNIPAINYYSRELNSIYADLSKLADIVRKFNKVFDEVWRLEKLVGTELEQISELQLMLSRKRYKLDEMHHIDRKVDDTKPATLRNRFRLP